MNCDAAIFDLDGTILDSLWVWEDISKDFLSKKGKDIPVTYIQELCSKSFQEAAEYTIRLFMLSETSQEVISEWNRLALIEYKHNIKLKKYCLPYLQYLKEEGKKLAMSNMGDYTNNLDFKVISYCKEDNIPVFYGDVVGVNSKIDNEKKDAAIKLANVIGNTETMVKAVSPDNNNPHPQYLLPARKSVYQTMGNVYPIYNELYSIVNQPENKLFLLGVSAEEWMNEAKENLAGLLN